MTISVIIPLSNHARFVTKALDSVFAQSIDPLEVIVVDDGTTDDSCAAVAAYPGVHRLVLLHKPRGGQASARNFGVQQASGTLIAFLDQDDIWYPHHLRDLSHTFLDEAEGAPGWSYSDLDEITEDGHLRTRSVLSTCSVEHPKRQLGKCLAADMLIVPSASMISRSAFDKVGGFDERLSGFECEDLFLRLFHAGYRNVFIDRPSGQWRVYPPGVADRAARADASKLLARKLLATFPDEPDCSRFYARDLIAPRFLSHIAAQARIAFRQGDIAGAEACLEEIEFLERQISLKPKPYPLRDVLFITVVIPLYNGARFIREAIRSVFDQTLPPDEIIVVDDGSSDSGADIVKEMGTQHPIRLINKPNGGQSSARNLGVEHAHGDLIAFLDQDDAWYPDHLAELVKPFLRRRTVELGWSYSDLDEVNENGGLVACAILGKTKTKHPKRDLADCLRQDMFILPSASLISRRAFVQVGGFDEQLSGYEDDDLFLRLFQAGFDNEFLPKSLSRWRIYQHSSSFSQRMSISRMIYARKMIRQFPEDLVLNRHPVRDLIAPRFFLLLAFEARNAILMGPIQRRRAALEDLHFIAGYLRSGYSVPLRYICLPILRVQPLARFIMLRWRDIVSIVRRLH